ncbi:hypothetical protein O181_040213 [Austropuccinia psidii MF-1]|uniref:Uncharacterized protein n=1 Tax=Austropuccinia psidii MF-1 TaxID=1389203 RepID=A0A9Q3HCN1_9BASI|nr:hypothetical protein [Austropuccinia psidii MF-1]
MTIKHSPPARKTRSQARAQARTQYGRSSPIQEGRKRARKINLTFRSSWQIYKTFKGPGEDGEEEEENFVEEAESDGTEGVPAPVGESQGTGGTTLAQYNQPVSHQSEPSLLAIMQPMTQIMSNLQADSSSD